MFFLALRKYFKVCFIIFFYPMQWVNTASTENKYCRYFHQVFTQICPSDFNEWHTLDKENKHVHKRKAGFEE